MTTQEQVQQYLEQPMRYFNIDGLGEIGIGVMMLGFVLLGWLQVATPHDSVWNQQWGFLVYMVLMITVIDRGTKVMKKRVTYPRTGFVEYRRGPKNRMVLVALGAAAAAAFAVLLIQRRVNPAAILGIVLVPAYAYGVARAVRWKWLVVSALAIGSLAIASLPADVLSAVARDSSPKFPAGWIGAWLLEALFVGVTVLASGGITLYQYLSRTGAPEKAPE